MKNKLFTKSELTQFLIAIVASLITYYCTDSYQIIVSYMKYLEPNNQKIVIFLLCSVLGIFLLRINELKFKSKSLEFIGNKLASLIKNWISFWPSILGIVTASVIIVSIEGEFSVEQLGLLAVCIFPFLALKYFFLEAKPYIKSKLYY